VQWFRKPLLYPAELRDHPFELYTILKFGAMARGSIATEIATEVRHFAPLMCFIAGWNAASSRAAASACIVLVTCE
jgi:hypothetical protein